MSVIDLLSTTLGVRDEAPNQELARKLAETSNHEGIKEIVIGYHDTLGLVIRSLLMTNDFLFFMYLNSESMKKEFDISPFLLKKHNNENRKTVYFVCLFWINPFFL